jgi:hypothetical protein
MFPALSSGQISRIASHGRIRLITRGEVLIEGGRTEVLSSLGCAPPQLSSAEMRVWVRGFFCVRAAFGFVSLNHRHQRIL